MKISTLAMLTGVSLALAIAANAAPQATPEAVVEETADAVTEALIDGSLSDGEAKRLLQSVDVDRIARFVLGQAGRSASEADYTAYRSAFETYLADTLQSQIDQFDGGSIEIEGTVSPRPKETIVETVVVDGAGESQRVNWRLKRTSDGWQIVDIEAMGLWLAIEQRAQISAALDDVDGDVGALADELSD